MSENDLRLLRMADKEEAGHDLLSWCLLAGAAAIVILMFIALRLAN
jgi:hypothetical protein